MEWVETRWNEGGVHGRWRNAKEECESGFDLNEKDPLPLQHLSRSTLWKAWGELVYMPLRMQ